MTTIPSAVAILAVWCFAQGEGRKVQLPSEHRIREMLRVDDQLGGEQQILIKLGERAFPAYLRILAAKDVEPVEITRIFVALAAVKADRSQFLEHTVAGLAHQKAGVRVAAVQLLAQIGSSRDTAPVVTLLSDEAWEVPFAAAKTLVAIGDQRALAAMDVWLNSAIHRANAAEYKAQREHVAECRDKLKQRLEKAKKSGQ